ncbi:MAG: peptide-methionine (S)-S-oxide reductase MsrA, partial [Verrucomicrobiota bacterium]
MKTISVILIAALLTLAFGALSLTSPATARTTKDMSELPENAQTAVFGGGCFWCTEAVFERIDGVLRVESGYMGGTLENPTYKQITTGTTGHAEVIKIDFDPEKVTYEQLVGLHFISHDPTTLNRQGADVGTQYRSAVFTYGDEQQATAQRVKDQLEASGDFR